MYFYYFEKNLRGSVISIEVTLPRSFQVQGDFFCWLQMLLAIQSLSDTSVMIKILIIQVRLRIRFLEDRNQDSWTSDVKYLNKSL